MLLFSYLYKQFGLFDSPGFQASFHAVRCAPARPVSATSAPDASHHAQTLRAGDGGARGVQDL